MIEVRKAAYHEAAHVISAYFLGYTCGATKIDEKGNGCSMLKYGNDTNVVEIFKKNYKNPSALADWFNSLSKSKKNYVSTVAENYFIISISGGVAETIYEHSLKKSDELKIEITGPDLITTETLSKCFKFDLEETILRVSYILKQPEFRNAVEVLANVMLESVNRTITNEVIMANLEHSGFLKYLNQKAKFK